MSLVLVALAGVTPTATAQELDARTVLRVVEQQVVDVIAKCEGSVVSIVKAGTQVRDEGRLFNPMRRLPVDRPVDLTSVPQAFGSGVIIASEVGGDSRFVLTNYHVLQPSDRGEGGSSLREAIYVRLSNHRAVRAGVIAADPRSDLAVLRLDLTGSGIDPQTVKPLQLGDASSIRKGQFVLALGNPYAIARDGSASASWGMISNISRRPADESGGVEQESTGTIHQYGTLIHVDTRLSLGTSGGALVNLDGELIGLTTSLAALQGYEQSVGFAIPIDADIRRVIDSLLQGYEVEYGFLGIQPGDVRPEELLRTSIDQVSAARAMFVSGDSPASRGGIRSDDLILKIDGKPVRSADDLMRDIGLRGPGAVVQIELWRPALRRSIRAEVTLAKWPVMDDSKIVATQRRYPTWRGLDVDYPTARRRFLTSDVMERYHAAVLVLNVAEDSPAFAAGLRPGDFITEVGGTSVETPSEFQAAVSGIEEPLILNRLDGTQVTVEVPSPE